MTIYLYSYVIEPAFQVANPELARIGIENVLETATLSATTTAAGKSLDNLKTRDTFQSWRPTTADAVLTAVLVPAKTVDFFAIAAHDMGTKNVQAIVEIKLGSGEWLTVATLQPSTDDPVLVPFQPREVHELRVTFSSTTAGIPTIAVMFLGEAVIMERPIYSSMSPLWLSRNTDIDQQISDSGQLLGSIVIRRASAVSPSWKYLSKAFYNSTLRSLATDLPFKPFFFSWSAKDAPDEIMYGQASDPRGEHMRNLPLYSFEFSMSGIAPR